MKAAEVVTITAADAISAMQKCVEERGFNYVYRKIDDGKPCLNWHEETDEPGCIVGMALYKLGVPAEILRANDVGPAGQWQDMLREVNLKDYGCEFNHFRITRNATTLFTIAQVAQDNGAPWGAALETARWVEMNLVTDRVDLP